MIEVASKVRRNHEGELGIGLFARDFVGVADKSRDREGLARMQRHAWMHREKLTSDYHADRLIAFFREAIEEAGSMFRPVLGAGRAPGPRSAAN